MTYMEVQDEREGKLNPLGTNQGPTFHLKRGAISSRIEPRLYDNNIEAFPPHHEPLDMFRGRLENSTLTARPASPIVVAHSHGMANHEIPPII
tara:strand:- start:1431 stop:1709 length:279 start_codon:yes stop_codon:yes gene_type:complete